MAAVQTYPTRIDLSGDVRAPMIIMLNQQLADTLDLYSQTKQAHWNVRGPEFYQLHLLFDQLAAGVVEYIDLIAERVTALGGEARGTVRMSAGASRLPDYPERISRGMQHVTLLAERYAAYAASTRAGIDISAEAGDAATSDLLTEIQRGVDKWLWFLEAHLQDEDHGARDGHNGARNGR